jgi:hypothetical protein
MANSDGLDQKIQENVSRCYAVQDKTWIQGPDNAWEFYTVLGEAPSMGCDISGPTGCASVADVVAVTGWRGCC